MMKMITQFFVGDRHIESAQVLEPHVENRIQGRLEEMRQATRLSLSVAVSYRVKSSASPWQLTTSQDYSSSGIRLILLSPLRPGTEIEMNIKLPEVSDPIHMYGIVVWVAQTSHRHAESRVIEGGVVFNKVQHNPHKETLIYLIANKLCQLGIRATKHLTTLPAQTIDDLKACYNAVYQGYVLRGYCAPHPSQAYYHYYCFLPQSRTFTLKDKDKLLGTISLVVDSPCGLPMDNLFSREINRLRAEGRKLAEVSLLAMAHHEKKKKFFSLTNFDKQVQLFRLFKIIYEYARHVAGVTDLVIGVHPKHETLYKYLMFRAIGSPKSYSEARGNPALPLHFDIIQGEKDYSGSLKEFFVTEKTPQETLCSGVQINADTVRKFLCEEQSIWSKMSPKVQDYFKHCYPYNSFGSKA